jgi:hypothetical protein
MPDEQGIPHLLFVSASIRRVDGSRNLLAALQSMVSPADRATNPDPGPGGGGKVTS